MAILFFMNMPFRLRAISKHTLWYGAALAALMFLMKWLELRYLIIDNAADIYMGAIALLFTLLGIWLALKLVKPKTETIIVEKEVYIEIPGRPAQAIENFTINENALEKSGISNRELEVLQLMATGLSNAEIAKHLFVSPNTVKTHSSNLFLKLDVKRRTQAVDKARKLGLVP